VRKLQCSAELAEKFSSDAAHMHIMHCAGQAFELRMTVCAQDNNFIRKGYRIGYSTRDVLVSVFTWHNETGNIHSHLIGDATCVTAPAIVLNCAVSNVDKIGDCVQNMAV
jgi:hypothetical protein